VGNLNIFGIKDVKGTDAEGTMGHERGVLNKGHAAQLGFDPK